MDALKCEDVHNIEEPAHRDKIDQSNDDIECLFCGEKACESEVLTHRWLNAPVAQCTSGSMHQRLNAPVA